MGGGGDAGHAVSACCHDVWWTMDAPGCTVLGDGRVGTENRLQYYALGGVQRGQSKT